MRSLLMMDGSRAIGLGDVAAAEGELGFALPTSLVALCLHQNGGTPNRSWLLDDEEQVDRFLPIEPRAGPDVSGIVSIRRRLLNEGLLPAESIPFAADAGDNFYLLDRLTGRVWFMPMDEWEDQETAEQNWARSGRTVAASLEAFLDAWSDEAPAWALD